MLDEKNIVRTMNYAYCLVVLPLVILLMPIERVLAHGWASIALLFVYALVIYAISKRYNWIIYLLRKNYLKVSIAITLAFVVAFIFMVLRQWVSYPELSGLSEVIASLYGRHLQTMGLLGLLSMCYGLLTGVMVELFNNIIHRQSLEAERNKAQLALYKTQINPHFLFNTFNTLYALHLTRSEHLGAFILQFSALVKYMYAHAESTEIQLADEAQYLENYIDLQRTRLGTNGKVNFECDIEEGEICIPPMLLITFVENAFKYGTSSSASYQIDITLEQKGNELRFSTQNAIFDKPQNSSGVGIENCRKRLDVIYPNRYQLLTHELTNIFHLQLIIQL